MPNIATSYPDRDQSTSRANYQNVVKITFFEKKINKMNVRRKLNFDTDSFCASEPEYFGDSPNLKSDAPEQVLAVRFITVKSQCECSQGSVDSEDEDDEAWESIPEVNFVSWPDAPGTPGTPPQQSEPMTLQNDDSFDEESFDEDSALHCEIVEFGDNAIYLD